MHLSKRTKEYLDIHICINAYGTDTSKGTLNAVLGCTNAFGTILPIASARRCWLFDNLEPNFFASGILNFLEKKRRNGRNLNSHVDIRTVRSTIRTFNVSRRRDSAPIYRT